LLAILGDLLKLAMILVLALVGCSDHNSPVSMPAQSPVAQDTTHGCRIAHDAVWYYSFHTSENLFRIHAPAGTLAASAKVTNDMNSGIWVHANGNAKSYVDAGGGSAHIEFDPRSRGVVLRAMETPSSGYVDISLRFCKGA
jgi:hypothetical protein